MSAAVVIGGAGIVGTWLREVLQHAGWSVVAVDTAGAELDADARGSDPRLRRLVAEADLVALALPEDVVLEVADSIEPLLRSDALLVSTASVQSPLFDTAAGRRRRRRLVGCNPMFRPTLSTAGRRVLLVTTADADETAALPLRDALQSSGALVEPRPADHDALMAVTQVLPHAALLAVASVLASSSIDPALVWRLAPPPARTVLACAARILEANPHVYADIQRADGAAEIRARLADGVLALGTDTTGELAERLTALRGSLSEIVAPAAALAAELFEHDGPTAPASRAESDS